MHTEWCLFLMERVFLKNEVAHIVLSYWFKYNKINSQRGMTGQIPYLSFYTLYQKGFSRLYNTSLSFIFALSTFWPLHSPRSDPCSLHDLTFIFDVHGNYAFLISVLIFWVWVALASCLTSLNITLITIYFIISLLYQMEELIHRSLLAWFQFGLRFGRFYLSVLRVDVPNGGALSTRIIWFMS